MSQTVEQLLWNYLGVSGPAEVEAWLKEWHRVMREGGELDAGPETQASEQPIWEAVGSGAHRRVARVIGYAQTVA